jgi:hypothetical protein
VSRALQELSAARNSTRDEGRPFEFGNLWPILSYRELLRQKRAAETPGQISTFTVERGARQANATEVSKAD